MRLEKLIKIFDEWYPPSLAEIWDRVGLIVGAVSQDINRILVTVDTSIAVVDYALKNKVDLIVSHHPLLLKGVNSVAETAEKGEIVAKLIKNDCALFSAHTNADKAVPGVSDALADSLKLQEVVPMIPEVNGKPGEGLGRIGVLSKEMPVFEFIDLVKNQLQLSAYGIRCAGKADTIIKTVAVCGGAGDSLLDIALNKKVDIYVTGDLRHHPVDEYLKAKGKLLLDVGHWASEFPWCEQFKRRVAAAIPEVEAMIYPFPTDNWLKI